MSPQTRCANCRAIIPADAEMCPECEQEFCPSCRAPLDADDTFCPRCGIEFAIFCAHCDEEIESDAVVCPHCGEVLEEEGTAVAQMVIIEQPAYKSPSQPDETESEAQEEFTGHCPVCQTPLFVDDGYCADCGAAFCGRCGQTVGEDDEICPHCHTPLFYECPTCQFELTAGTDICPNCNTLFPAFCSRCHASLTPGATACPECQHPVQASQRRTARVIHAVQVDMGLVRVVACPDCGKQFNPAAGACSACGYRVCPACQISLVDGERFCPRCGFDTAFVKQHACSSCHNPIAVGSDECPHCQQLLCPECLTAVAETDVTCPGCGAEFELLCPGCGAVVAVETAVCPQCDLAL